MLNTEGIIGVDLIYDVTMITVLLSVVLHGITAAPGADWYGSRMEKHAVESPGMAEHEPVKELPLRSGPRVLIW